ncbi:B12-binding domain-containing radical SAM protein [Patescibacteria group bacterium]
MKIVFVAIHTENLAVEQLSAYLKSHGHEVELVFDPQLFKSEAIQNKKLAKLFDIKQKLVKDILKHKPDVIGFSTFTFNYQRALELTREIKNHSPNTPIIFGGVHSTVVPEKVIQEKSVDVVCVGEGEQALLEYLENTHRTDIQNLWFKKDTEIIKNSCRPLMDNLDDLPFLDKKLFYNVYPGWQTDYYAISSRGCPFKCTYCANHTFHKIYDGLGKVVRRRSPENLIAELVWAKQNFKLKKITFVDDIFVQDTEWLRKFIPLYISKINLPYVVLTHPNFVNSEAIKLLKNSSCYLLSMGIQSANENTRQQILKRAGNNQQILDVAHWCHQYKLQFSIDHIFNIPNENTEDYKQALVFYNKIRPSIINTFWLQYFPKTEIIKTALQEKYLQHSDIEKIEQGLTSTSVVVGLGGKDSFSHNNYSNFQFWMIVLPLLPRKLMNKILKSNQYLKISPPLFINAFLKLIINLIRGRGNVYGGILKFYFFFIRKIHAI